MSAAAPRWAISQPRMHWTLEANLAETVAALEAAAAAGAEGCVCTELALTGFHRRLPELLGGDALAAALARLCAACGRLGIAAVVGLPTRGEGGAVFNSHVYIDAAGRECGRVHKRGLTPSEATFFTPGRARGWTALGSVLATSVLCRETLDGAQLLPELRAALPTGDDRQRVIFWPSYIADSDVEQAALCEAYRAGAAELARELQAWVLQSNWAESLNEPSHRGFGAGVVVAPDGRISQVLARDAADVAPVTLHGR
ncbi:nitrilase-related carbon-nitrogen hydrolase [Roseateles sp. BYS78W]|uniref:Nitrilase-related carbon-nitrogen hydrolase n=1 Tax=Pelomonas candidula TaxID=3299025 RepID=A0ABW7HG05_9BURK